ncbi:hypothetical protein N0V88_000679 [Collariella sp. IMI 366227]|nr:hypothetical protein N0V88_000679 [Collariella sp. IMI 366227]
MAILSNVMEALAQFETYLAKLDVLDSGSKERVPESHQAAPRPADENATPASHPVSDSNAAEKDWIPASSLEHPGTADDCDTADEPGAGSWWVMAEILRGGLSPESPR